MQQSQVVINTAEEFKEIVSQLKKLVAANMETGFDSPVLSQKTRDYLRESSAVPETLEELKNFIGECKRCELWQGRTLLVFGEGSPEARLVFVGEGPGREEDNTGRPFVGEAGRLLTRIIENGMRLKREEVYICNVVKCRPPSNRDPDRGEIDTCIPFLKEQLRLIGPEIICVLGRIAGQELLGKDFKISRDRGKWFSYMNIPVMPTYHPAYILRNPTKERQLKGEVWEDIQKIIARLGLGNKGNE